MKEYFDKLAVDRIKYRRRRKYYWKSITKYINYFLTNDKSVLEIGCGTGELIAEIKGKNKVGIDFSDKMIENAKNQFPDLDFRVMEAENLQFDQKFDVIVLSNLVGYLKDVQQVFEQVHKLSHSSTKIIITYYSYFWEPIIKIAELFRIKKKTPRQNWLSNLDIENLLNLAGFEVFRRNKRMLLPINIPIISFLFNRFLGALPFFNLFTLNQFLFARKIPSKKEEYSTSIVIPARNESGNIENAIKRLPKFGKHVEIIYVEGNSTDDTWETIQRIQQKYKDTHDIKITQQDGKGKGDAVRKGYSIATGDILMILDADLTVPPEDIPKFYDAIASGKGEFINGCRLVYPMEKDAMRFLNTIGNKFFSLLFSWLLEQPIKDTLCGTKVMFRTDYIRLQENRKFFGEFDPFGDFDLLFGAYKLNLKIIDLPIRYRERIYGDTNISRFKHGFILLRMCWYAAGKIKFW
ncbi:MAG: glycosyltransferase [Bacteroidales bacterium]|nr:glycosyltransferase [Bacteroidales bacterium]